MTTRKQSTLEYQDHDLGVESDPLNMYPEYGAEGRYLTEEYNMRKALKNVVAFAMRNYENCKEDHRTGCGFILEAITEALIEQRGWESRVAVDAIVLEAVRAGGNVLGRETRKRLAARKAAQP